MRTSSWHLETQQRAMSEPLLPFFKLCPYRCARVSRQLTCNNAVFRALKEIRKEIGNTGKMDLMTVDMADFG